MQNSRTLGRSRSSTNLRLHPRALALVIAMVIGVALALVIAMVIGVCGCGGGTTYSSPPPPPSFRMRPSPANTMWY